MNLVILLFHFLQRKHSSLFLKYELVKHYWECTNNFFVDYSIFGWVVILWKKREDLCKKNNKKTPKENQENWLSTRFNQSLSSSLNERLMAVTAWNKHHSQAQFLECCICWQHDWACIVLKIKGQPRNESVGDWKWTKTQPNYFLKARAHGCSAVETNKTPLFAFR